MTDRKDDGQKNANQGEGNREAARNYNDATREFVRSGRVDDKAREAERALSGSEGDELRRAEEKGKKRAKEEDPEVSRDIPKPG